MTRLILYTGLAALFLGGVVSQASAEDRTVIATAVVKTSDLNLAADEGARVLLRRVAAKANDLCTQTDTPLARGAEKSRRACVAKAVATSAAGINSLAVTAEFTRVYGAAPTVVATR
jgi:UrcA family protein